nr:hypothetical protein BaRGS_034829 [Batillaria attramentaria]
MSSDYPTNVDCTYVIEQNPGKQIELTFTSFNMADMTDSQCTDFVEWTITVEPGLRIELTFDTMAIYGWGRNCNYGHYVKMYDSNTVDDNTLIDTYCGATVVPPVRSTGNVMTVVFQSNYYSSWWYTYYNFNGFSAFYTSFDPSDPSVLQNDLFLFGLAQGDTELQFNGNNDAKHITLDLGIPFGNALEKNIHIGSNGVVSFGSRYTYPYLSWYGKMVCVYASYIDNSVGGVYYQVYNGEGDRDEEVLTKATDEVREFTESDTFQASLVLVVTWERVQQRNYYYYYYSDATVDWECGSTNWVKECQTLSKPASRGKFVVKDGAKATYQKLIVGPPLAGAAQAYNPDSYSQRDKHVTEDRNPHDWCCKQSDLAGFCELYYIVRPVGQCRDKIPFRFSWMFGDPHIETLDGRQYTFNGLGEYTLVTFANFTLQGRTALAKTDSGTPTNATVFTAFGAEENNIRVFVGLDPTMEIYANGTDYSLRFRQEEDLEVDTDDFYLARDNNSLVVAFPSQISLSVSVGLSSLDMSVTIPEEFKGQPSGLMGNYNDDDTDDFVLADGTTLSNTLSERQLYDQFGTKWAINETASVMRYGQKKGPADYADPDFIPLFLDEQPDDVRQAAENQCGGSANLACIYDYVATGSQAFATASKQTAETVNATEAQSSEYAKQYLHAYRA